jgi:uncharacterized protein (TIGR02300 family)
MSREPFSPCRRNLNMAKPELGTKRVCDNCTRKFYDLNKDPIVCPTCATVFVPPKPAPTRPGRMVYPRPAVKTAIPNVPAEFAPLATTDEDTEDVKSPAAEEDIDDKKADASFIVLEADDEEDAADIIGDGVKKDEET